MTGLETLPARVQRQCNAETVEHNRFIPTIAYLLSAGSVNGLFMEDPMPTQETNMAAKTFY